MQITGPAPVGAPLDPSRPEDAVITALISVGRLMKAQGGIGGLDPGTHHLLHRLECAGTLRVTDLAAALRLDTSTVSRHVQSLERSGLVVRTPHPEDGRAQAVELTEAGRTALAEALQTRRQLLSDLLADWDRDDVVTLARLLTAFSHDIDTRTQQLEHA